MSASLCWLGGVVICKGIIAPKTDQIWFSNISLNLLYLIITNLTNCRYRFTYILDQYLRIKCPRLMKQLRMYGFIDMCNTVSRNVPLSLMEHNSEIRNAFVGGLTSTFVRRGNILEFYFIDEIIVNQIIHVLELENMEYIKIYHTYGGVKLRLSAFHI